MKLSQWAKEQGVSYRTAWRWFRDGKLPVAAEQFPTGTILVKEAKSAANTAAVYARVSSTDQAGDLDRQVARVVEHLNTQGIAVIRTVREVGPGLNGHRPKLLRLESRIDRAVREELDRRGHRVMAVEDWSEGFVLAVGRNPSTGLLEGAADPRGQISGVMPAHVIGW